MDKGDERAALRAEAKYRRIDVKPEKNIYDYGPSDPDPTVDYYFEPLSPEEQAKFDKEDRREHGLTEEEIADFSGKPTQKAKSDPLVQLTQTAAAHNTPILPNPLAAKRKKPHHPQPLKSPLPQNKVPSPLTGKVRMGVINPFHPVSPHPVR